MFVLLRLLVHRDVPVLCADLDDATGLLPLPRRVDLRKYRGNIGCREKKIPLPGGDGFNLFRKHCSASLLLEVKSCPYPDSLVSITY